MQWNENPPVERCSMNRILQILESILITLVFFAVILAVIYSTPKKARAFNNNSGRNLPFCDTTMTPSWDPPGIWYEWCGRKWFVPDPNGVNKKLSRTFYVKKQRQEQLEKGYQVTVARLKREFDRYQAVKKVQHTSALEITYQDMQNVYAFNSNVIESYASPQNSQMDLGIFDPYFTAPQRWTMPTNVKFNTISRKILDPKTTPYGLMAPEATHCLYVKSPNAGIDIYDYYLLDQDGLWSLGEQVSGTASVGGDMHALNFSEYDEEEMMTLPLDVNTVFYSGYGEDTTWTSIGDTTWYDDTHYGLDVWYYMSEAYGTLVTPDDGTVDVIKIAYQWIWSEWEVDEASVDGEDALLDYENGTEIYFYSKNGHQLMISLDSLGVETTGMVKPNFVYYQKVKKPATLVARQQSITTPSLAMYPNPTRGMISFDAPISFGVWDLLGRQVYYSKNTRQANLSHLPRGMYFIRPEKGKAQKLIIQK
jgi:hypothetical protein